MAPSPKLPADEEKHLEGLVAEFRRRNGAERKLLLDECARKLLSMRRILAPTPVTEEYTLLVEFFYQKVRNWFNNRIQENKDKATRLPTRINRTWTGERVFEFLKNTDIREAVRDDEVLHPHQIVAWNLMRRSLWEDLEQDEREDYGTMALQWNISGPDVKLQPRMAERRAIGWMRSDIKMYWEQCGMIMIMYGLFPDEAGDLCSIRLDTSDYVAEAAGKEGRKLSRFTSNQDWDKDLRANAGAFFGAWYNSLRGINPTEITIRNQAVIFTFLRYSDGTPILTDTENGEALIGTRRQEVWRQYVRIHYSFAKGVEVKATPWTAIIKDPSAFFDMDMFPAGTVLQDPSHMNDGPLSQIFRHIMAMEHPTDDSEPRFFRFANYMTGNSTRPLYHKAHYTALPSAREPTVAPEPAFHLPAFFPKHIDPANWESFPEPPEASTSQSAKRTKKKQPKQRAEAQEESVRHDSPAAHPVGTSRSAAKTQPSKASTRPPLQAAKKSKKSQKSRNTDESDEAEHTPPREDDIESESDGNVDLEGDHDDSGDSDDSGLHDLLARTKPIASSTAKAKGKGKEKAVNHSIRRASIPRMLFSPCSSGHDAQERWQFLRALSSYRPYIDMLDRARSKLQQDCYVDAPAAAPWATWLWTSPHLPREAHQDSAALNAVFAWLSNGVALSAPAGHVQRFCLAIGLLLRDTGIVHDDIDDDDHIPHNLPEYFSRSLLRNGDVDRILDICAEAFARPRARPVKAAHAAALGSTSGDAKASGALSELPTESGSSPPADWAADLPSPPHLPLDSPRMVTHDLSSPMDFDFDDPDLAEAIELSLQDSAPVAFEVVGEVESSPLSAPPVSAEDNPPDFTLLPHPVTDWDDDSFDARQIEADLVTERPTAVDHSELPPAHHEVDALVQRPVTRKRARSSAVKENAPVGEAHTSTSSGVRTRRQIKDAEAAAKQLASPPKKRLRSHHRKG
ncbi:hypothetical protein OH76DRAFT_1417680 [Lentinus brumalis]|uniref:Uncharacterized protein n=1 Tax=Lentinus brumalis TaxID=2498619 RepID=A0A371DDM1_9APHY|nr:hypothetical protein OH76DRAFT_1417680 [Polyporus brumalis]